jgi:hypothetical protein
MRAALQLGAAHQLKRALKIAWRLVTAGPPWQDAVTYTRGLTC